MNRCCLAATLAGFLSATTPALPIVVDGEFGDWPEGSVVATDPPGDAAGDVFDITSVRAVGAGSVVWIRFDVAETVNIQSGPEEEGSLVLSVGPEAGAKLEVDFRARSFHVVAGDEPTAKSWPDFGFRAAPTHASREFEVRLDLSSLGARRGERIAIQFSGDDELDRAAIVELAPDRAARLAGSDIALAKSRGTALRVASFNTLRGGLSKADLRPAFRRLLAAADADVFAFQEEEQSTTAQIVAVVSDATDTDAREWSVRRSAGGCVIASRFPLAPVIDFNERYEAAIAQVPGLGPVIIANVHFKCCGHIGSDEDSTRIAQARDVVRSIRNASAASPTPPHFVIAGDWNLVGSRDPLTIAEAELGAARARIAHPSTGEVHTWYDEASSFAPGQLDLVAVSDTLARRTSGFVLDSRSLDADHLRETGLIPTDSAVSDHLVLIVDVARSRGDAPSGAD